MANMEEFQERLEAEAIAEEKYLKQAVKKYGEKLGSLYHQFLYSESNDQKARMMFYLAIAQIFESGSLEEKALAIEAMISVTEVRITALERSVSRSNAVY